MDQCSWHQLARHESVPWPEFPTYNCRTVRNINKPSGCVVQELISHSHSIAEFFTADDWEYHQTSRRYFRNLINIGTSTVFRCVPSSHRAADVTARCFLPPAACYAGGQAGEMVQCAGCNTLKLESSCRRILAPCLMVAGFAALVALYNGFAPLLHYPLPGIL